MTSAKQDAAAGCSSPASHQQHRAQQGQQAHSGGLLGRRNAAASPAAPSGRAPARTDLPASWLACGRRCEVSRLPRLAMGQLHAGLQAQCQLWLRGAAGHCTQAACWVHRTCNSQSAPAGQRGTRPALCAVRTGLLHWVAPPRCRSACCAGSVRRPAPVSAAAPARFALHDKAISQLWQRSWKLPAGRAACSAALGSTSTLQAPASGKA